MNIRKDIDGFLAQKTIAVVGVSRSPNKFANAAFRELRKKGYRVFPVNPNAVTVEGERCYHRTADIEPRPHAALIITPPAQTETAVREATSAGIRRLWIQQGAESEAALRLAETSGAAVVNGECVLMFAEPAAFYHRLHRWVWKLLGRLPQ
jgi:predicted CoA-binding protein